MKLFRNKALFWHFFGKFENPLLLLVSLFRFKPFKLVSRISVVIAAWYIAGAFILYHASQ